MDLHRDFLGTRSSRELFTTYDALGIKDFFSDFIYSTILSIRLLSFIIICLS
jgi:hypothetical protein